MPIIETIRSRISVRTYVDKPLSREAETALEARLEALSEEYGVTLQLLKNEHKSRKFGTYGIIKNPAAYIACGCANTTDGLLRTGQAGEWAVLACAELGLGTCWLGGTFKREAFGEAMRLPEGSLLPAVISVGYPGRERLLGSVMRMGAKSDQRTPSIELFFEGGMSRPLQPVGDTQAQALEAVRLGPSASNKQPWRVIRDGSGMHFYLAHTPGYTKAMAFDMQVLDIGIAMAHYEAIMREAGQDGRWVRADPEIPGLPGDVEYMMTWVDAGADGEARAGDEADAEGEAENAEAEAEYAETEAEYVEAEAEYAEAEAEYAEAEAENAEVEAEYAEAEEDPQDEEAYAEAEAD